jgi:2-succinyl-5-enolpyruvyl-6-hydroxy-3-cyclohexene-1-carboxylate synthase
MSERTANLNRFWAELIVEELIRNDVRTFCLASGSRCSPLTIAVARHPSAQSVIHLDERGLGFFAVGHARASGRPAAVITTSGTAAANLLPSVIESSQSHLPLIVLSADRPPELRDTAANQTMRQPGLFGSYIRSETDMPCPAEEIAPGYVLSTIDHAVQASLHPSPGPVHLNLMFREPLVPAGQDQPPDPAVVDVAPWFGSAGPFTQCNIPESTPREEDVGRIADLLVGANRGMILAGELRSSAARGRALEMARHLNWPLVADVLSGLRCTADPLVVGAGLFNPRVDLVKEVDTVLHVGGRFVSREPVRHFAANRPAVYAHVTPHVSRSDPGYFVTHRLEGAPELSLACLQSRSPQSPSSDFTTEITEAWSLIQARIEKEESCDTISEPMVARALTRELPVGHGLFLGNSMPVRDVDQFAAARDDQPEFAANRGVSGIDGLISSGFGFSAGLGAPATLFLGDLSCLHDLNGLKFAAEAPHPVTVVAVNNNGGGIFNFLPVASHTDVFESHFGTPHGMRLEEAAKMFGLSYLRSESMSEFRSTYRNAAASGSCCLIEVFTNRKENVEYHRQLEP